MVIHTLKNNAVKKKENKNEKNIIVRNHKHRKTGLPPGTLVYTGKKQNEKISINVLSYNENSCTEKTYTKAENHLLKPAENVVTWMNINGLHDPALISKIGEFYNIHNLILEDILNVDQIPKVEEDPENDLIYITLNEFYFDDNEQLERDQISLILGKNFVLSFQEEQGDYFEIIRDRIRTAKGRVRKKGADYLAYVLIDAIVDSYYIVLDHYSNEIDNIENNIFINKNKNQLNNIHLSNKALIYLRRSIAPLQEVVFKLLKVDIILIEQDSKIFLRDLQDHVNQVVSQIDVDR